MSPTGIPGISIFKPSKDKKKPGRPYKIAYYDQNHRRQVCTGYTDREATIQKAMQIRRLVDRRMAGIVDSEDVHGRQPIAEHVEAYIASRRFRKRSDAYIAQLERRIRRTLDGADIRSLNELDTPKIEAFLATAIDGDRTRNEYVTSVKGFTRWAVHNQRLKSDPLAGLERVEAKHIERRHVRRALMPDEIARLLEAVETRPLIEAETVRRGEHKGERVAKVRPFTRARLLKVGRERRLAYLCALWTGLRRSELAQLTWGDVDLPNAVIRLRPQTTKSRRADSIVLHPELVDALTGMRPTSARPSDPVLTSIPSIRTVHLDLEFAGIEAAGTADHPGVVDFHALRKTFGSLMAMAGIDQRVRQALMRHADPRLTEGVYIDESLLPIRKSLQSMEPMAAPAQKTADQRENE